MRGTDPPLAQFGQAFHWLLARGISSAQIGNAFGTTAGNVRVIAFRRSPEELGTPGESALATPPEPNLKEAYGFRPSLDAVVRTPVNKRKLDSLKEEVADTVRRFSQGYSFLEGAQALRRFLQQVGYAEDSRRVGLGATVHQQTAWFLVHSGRCRSAAREARIARDLWRIAYHETKRHEYGSGFIQASLIGSNALLLAHQPLEAWSVLEVARDAAESIGEALGSEHHRQRAVALFQRREDDQAIKHFQKATETMEKRNEATVPAQLLMTGARHISLLGRPDCNTSQLVLDAASLAFGSSSLEASMAQNWATACALSTDSTGEIHRAIDLINRFPSPMPQFGHQMTIRRLLAATLDLGLDARLRRAWVRRALYETAFRDR